MRRSLLVSLLAGLLVLLSSLFAGATRSAPPAQSLTIDPASWAAGTVTVGNASSTEFTVTYSGKGNSGALHISFGGSTTFAPGASDTCTGASLSSKNPTCSIRVNFAPASPTAYAATLYLDGRKLSTSASLTGTGQAAALPTLSINDPAPLAYGGTVGFTVTMSRPSSTPATFDWATADGTAVWVSGTTCGGFNGPNDYVAGSGTKTIAAGSTSTTISVQTCSTGPGNRQPDPTNFTVTISNPSGATITDGTGTATLNST